MSYIGFYIGCVLRWFLRFKGPEESILLIRNKENWTSGPVHLQLFESQRRKDCPVWFVHRLSSSKFCTFFFLGLISHDESSPLTQVWSDGDTLIPADALAPVPPFNPPPRETVLHPCRALQFRAPFDNVFRDAPSVARPDDGPIRAVYKFGTFRQTSLVTFTIGEDL